VAPTPVERKLTEFEKFEQNVWLLPDEITKPKPSAKTMKPSSDYEFTCELFVGDEVEIVYENCASYKKVGVLTSVPAFVGRMEIGSYLVQIYGKTDRNSFGKRSSLRLVRRGPNAK
jgi:hypothetical protein